MLRTYLDGNKRWRLNVWDDRLRVRDVSIIHDHPWSFVSYVFSGGIRNQRYYVRDDGDMTHCYHQIVTGEEGGPLPQKFMCGLVKWQAEVYRAGQGYSQHLEEVHDTHATRGTVTLNDRTPPTTAHTARVFWPIGTEWVDAKPRRATPREIQETLEYALDMWFMEGTQWDPRDLAASKGVAA